MPAIMENKTIRNLKLSPKLIPNAIPGFSTRLILKKFPSNEILCPSYIPCIFKFKNGIEKPLTSSFENWSISTTANEINNTFNPNLHFQLYRSNYVLNTKSKFSTLTVYLFSCFCFIGKQSWLWGTASNLALGTSGQVSQRCCGSSIHSKQIPYVPESIRFKASSK